MHAEDIPQLVEAQGVCNLVNETAPGLSFTAISSRPQTAKDVQKPTTTRTTKIQNSEELQRPTCLVNHSKETTDISLH